MPMQQLERVQVLRGNDHEDLAGFAIPEPASLLLFGSLVLGLATFVRRKSSANLGSLDPV